MARDEPDRGSDGPGRFASQRRPLWIGGVRGIALVTLATAGLAVVAALIALLISLLY